MNELKKELKLHALSSRIAEICGFIGQKDGKLLYKKTTNHNPEPQKFFSISPLDQLSFRRENVLVAVFHSHLNCDCLATEFDKVNSENLALPFVIYSIPQNKFSIFVPPNSEISGEILKELEGLFND